MSSENPTIIETMGAFLKYLLKKLIHPIVLGKCVLGNIGGVVLQVCELSVCISIHYANKGSD